jgi:hypothetical protein
MEQRIEFVSPDGDYFPLTYLLRSGQMGARFIDFNSIYTYPGRKVFNLENREVEYIVLPAGHRPEDLNVPFGYKYVYKCVDVTKSEILRMQRHPQVDYIMIPPVTRRVEVVRDTLASGQIFKALIMFETVGNIRDEMLLYGSNHWIHKWITSDPYVYGAHGVIFSPSQGRRIKADINHRALEVSTENSIFVRYNEYVVSAWMESVTPLHFMEWLEKMKVGI